MKLIPLTQNKFSLVDDCDYDMLVQYRWHTIKNAKNYYASRKLSKEEQLIFGVENISMHRFLLVDHLKPGLVCDHINHNGLDNRRSNLRICSHAQNQQNRSSMATNSSGYRGVTFNKAVDKWQAQLRFGGSYVYLGIYTSPKNAALAYNQAAIKHFGEYANLNVL